MTRVLCILLYFVVRNATLSTLYTDTQ